MTRQKSVLRNDASFNQGSSPTSSGLFADIEGLKAGFGTYTGERRGIGEAEDPAKADVRSNIDMIRVAALMRHSGYTRKEIMMAHFLHRELHIWIAMRV